MTAVFYTGLTGKHLSVVQSLQTSVPEFADIGCFRDCPSTVLEMVRAILKKGLYPIARRRYQSVAGMLRDFEELSDRIEGKGITHWPCGKRAASGCEGRSRAIRHFTISAGKKSCIRCAPRRKREKRCRFWIRRFSAKQTIPRWF